MKHVLFLLCLFLTLIAGIASAEQLPPHMSGVGMFTWQETVKVGDAAFAEEAKEYGLSHVIVKSHDGSTWGTKMDGVWKPAIGRGLITELHKRNIRTYTYFTARLASDDDSIDKSIALAEQTLAWGADGVVVDDLGLFGKSRAKWIRLFAGMRAVVDRYPGTILGASSFPHLMRWDDCPWDVAIQYSDYFLPQNYWKLFRGMEPELAIAYGQSNFDALRSYTESACEKNKSACRKTKEPCKLVPVGMSYGKRVTAEQIEKFLTSAKPFYAGVTLFRWGTVPSGGWNVIKNASKQYTRNRPLRAISSIEIIRGEKTQKHPEQEIVDSSPTPKKPAVGKQGGTKKIERPVRNQSDPPSRCGACP